MLLLSDKFKEVCQGATIYLDTNAFIHAFDQDDLKVLFGELALNKQVAFVTLSSVEYEFTRGARSLDELQARREFVRSLVYQVMPVGKLLESDKNDAFSVVMSIVLSKKSSQYTDYLLAAALHTYNHVDQQFVLSADLRAFPDNIFTIHGVVTTTLRQGETVHLHLISLDYQKYTQVLGGIK